MTEKAKILMLVEGDQDKRLMEKLFSLYEIGDSHEIVVYHTNIYVLYNSMFRDTDPESVDLQQLLKSMETDDEKKKIFDEHYSDILLIFDLDPQDGGFSDERILRMTEFFKESTETGKLYLNYPMVEAFYHMRTIPDPDYCHYTVSMEELRQKTYKMRVTVENRDHDHRKFAKTKTECSLVINQNIDKARMLVKTHTDTDAVPPSIDILKVQLEMLRKDSIISVLATCPFFIYDYNPNLLS